MYAGGATIRSACSGGMLIAETGLLDGHEATAHGDAAIATAQRWIAANVAVANPLEQMVEQSGLKARTFKRRFRAATGETPIAYVRRIRVERAKRLLEQGGDPIEEISSAVGYDDPASFRRLFKRLTGLTAGEYRLRFRPPAVA